MGRSGLVVGFRAAGSGSVLHVRIVPRLSQVDRGARLGEFQQTASSTAAAAAAGLAQGRSTTAPGGAQESETITASSTAQRQLNNIQSAQVRAHSEITSRSEGEG